MNRDSLPRPDTMAQLRLDSALAKRKSAKSGELSNVRCEVCSTLIRTYEGPLEGILCQRCFDTSAAGCTRIMPLVILRSAIQEGAK